MINFFYVLLIAPTGELRKENKFIWNAWLELEHKVVLESWCMLWVIHQYRC